MKNYHSWWLVLLVGLVAGCGRAPLERKPTALSAEWLTLTRAEEGFEIKYPPGWRRDEGPDGVTLGLGKRGTRVSVVRLVDAAKRREWEEVRRASATAPRAVRIGNVTGEQTVQAEEAAFAGNQIETTHVTIDRDDATYRVSWTLGFAAPDGPVSLGAICEEMIATFRFVERRPGGAATYADPLSGVAFDYPPGWIFQVEEGDGFAATLKELPADRTQGPRRTIRLEFKQGASFERFRNSMPDEVLGAEPERKLFKHQLRGRRFRWNEDEAYALEKSSGTLIVRIQKGAERRDAERKSVDEFLDSLRF